MRWGAIEDCTPEEMRAQMDTNFGGTFLMCRAVAPVMRAQGTGTIINVSSLAGIFGVPFAGPYSASKFAVEGMTEALRHELRPFGVRVCLLEPGDIDTNLPVNRRLVGGDTTSGPYATAYARYAANQDKDEANCPGPEIVARRIAKILNTGNPPLRHVVGENRPKGWSFPRKSFCPNASSKPWYARRSGVDRDSATGYPHRPG